MARVRAGSVVLRMMYRRACLPGAELDLAVCDGEARGGYFSLYIPLGFGSLEGFPLGVVADRPDIDEAAEV